MLKIYKFGGAAVRDAEAIRNVGNILIREGHEKNLVVVISAMGSTTNKLESLFFNRFFQKEDALFNVEFDALRHFTLQVAQDLELGQAELQKIGQWMDTLLGKLADKLHEKPMDQAYDQIVGFGELISTTVVCAHLKQAGLNVRWLDAREIIATDETWREAKIDWATTQANMEQVVAPLAHEHLLISQGFIGYTPERQTTTLGREGSDYTASIFAHCLNADSLTTWKDVKGILNLDPRKFPSPKQFKRLSYTEAAEMTYYGASVIHPKTIRPLALKQIPLIVRSFLDHEAEGTIISSEKAKAEYPSIIVKGKQCMLTFGVRDFEYVGKNHLLSVIHELHEVGLIPNMLKITAMSLSCVVDQKKERIEQLYEKLEKDFYIELREHLELLTIKNYTESYLKAYAPKIPLLEERSEHNYRAAYPSS